MESAQFCKIQIDIKAWTLCLPGFFANIGSMLPERHESVNKKSDKYLMCVKVYLLFLFSFIISGKYM